MSKKIKKGDNVIVISGKDKGKSGEVYVIDRQTNIPRIRISSIEPNLINDEIIEFISSNKSSIIWNIVPNKDP